MGKELRACEIEYKFDAKNITFLDLETIITFNKFGPYEIIKRQFFDGFDDYYQMNKNIVRHRQWGDRSQLTIKLRKSKKSITNRIEQDLNFSKKTSIKDIANFLKFAGCRMIFKLEKSALVLWLESAEGTHFTLSLYEVHKINEPKTLRRFLEIEVEKTNNITEKQAEKELNTFKKLIETLFDLKKPLNKSLYEIFSGKNYKVYSEKDCK